MSECHHLHLKKCIVGEVKFYKCENTECNKNFTLPEPFVIEVVEHKDTTKE